MKGASSALSFKSGWKFVRKTFSEIPVSVGIMSSAASSTPAESETISNRRKKRRHRKRKGSPEAQGNAEESASCSVPAAHPQKRTKFFDEDMYNETSYYMDNGLRKVYPYYYTFSTHCKGRWVGITLHEVFRREFRSESPEYYAAAINSGMITVNGRKASLDYVMKNNDFMRSRVHRHEPPVTGKAINIIECNQDILVINKPASIPVHPSGRYRHNTIMFLLGKELNFRNLHTIHRLDRLTSGLLMFARTLEMSQKLDSLVRGRELRKTYVSRVRGEFPSEPVVCSEPILTMSHKIGVCRVSPDGKPCKTEFYRISYNGSSSVVRCIPHTGRMHQIRVHLQYLGYPIINDPLYTSSAWGPDTAKGGVVNKTTEEILAALIENHNRENQATVMEDSTEEIAGLIQRTARSGEMNDCRGQVEVMQETETAKEMNDGAGETDAQEIDAVWKRGSGNETGQEARATEEKGEHEGGARAVVDLGKTAVANLLMSGETGKGVEKTQDDGAGEIECCRDTERIAKDSTDDARSVSMNKESRQASIDIQEMNAESADGSDDRNTDDVSMSQQHSEVVKDPMCKECRLRHRDPLPHEMVMYLHALSYKGPDFEYSTPLPDWAHEDWKEPKRTASAPE
ncbi:pseudouridylate synthase RPUSD2-like [Ptychodera flava]|uniref:pseudouridylate synthase RPUSD2-like n=1 Tax=Ptychodera flava TaxID=63121 RepID=UPI003969BBF2